MAKNGRNDSTAIDLVREIGIKHSWLKANSGDELE
jgi:hypothetical protein